MKGHTETAIKIIAALIFGSLVILQAANLKQIQNTWYVADYHDNAIELVHKSMRYTVDVTLDSSLVTYVGQRLPNCKEGFTGLCIEQTEFGGIRAHEADIAYVNSYRVIAIRPE